jgi:hypothetical protein
VGYGAYLTHIVFRLEGPRKPRVEELCLVSQVHRHVKLWHYVKQPPFMPKCPLFSHMELVKAVSM